MASVGIVPKILISVVWVGIVRNPLTYSQLQISFEKIEVVMGVHPKMFSKGWVVHILIDERKP